MGFTAHWIDDQWKLVSRCLGTKFVPQDHTATKLGECMEDVMKHWELDPKKLSAITTDNAANVLKECATRWGSTHRMISKFLKSKKALRRVLNKDKDTAHLVPKWQDIEVLEAVDAALSPLAQFTDIMCASKYVTISALKPVLYRLKHEELAVGEKDLPLTASIKKNIMKYLEDKYASDEKQQLMNVTCFLDPRYKSDFFPDNEEPEAEGCDIETVCELDAVKETLLKDAVFLKMPEETVEEHSNQPPPSKKAKKTLGSLTSMKKIKQSPSPAQSPRDRVANEIARYLQFPTIDGDDDPLQWWKFHENDFPLLSQYVRRYLAIPASSAPTERLFSKAGQIVTAKRVNLKPSQANMLVFLAENL
ncbi:zinc finger BED domain-containing protein 1-like [Dendronephthya gigantea]|uniref:zinc finger BED domain-containing protein 1-like n=1 Tax=Dendronephthya gigantea TaxID=151771 RepID=UPI00106C4427|nr:zinc finger BED domain-containing protein 1-like [Dendronephthya gigantea]